MDKALKWLGFALFLLFAAPRMSVRVGPVPLYFLDALLVIAWFYALKLSRTPRHSSMSPWVIGLILVAAISELHGALYIHDITRPVYMIFRASLAMSLFFLVPRVVRSKEAVITLFKWIAAGAIVSAMMMLFSSMPPTRGIARAVFNLPLLDPASDSAFMSIFEDGDSAVRGRSLIGVSNLSAAYLIVAWPMALFLREKYSAFLSRFWKLLITLSCIMAPFGIIASYSRGGLTGLLGVVFTALLLTKSKSLKVGVIVGSVFLVVVVGVIGVDSKLFFFERVERRVDAMINDPMDDGQEIGRVYAYLHPFIYVAEHPIAFFFGTGNAKNSVRNMPAHPLFNTGGNHAVIAQATYSYGLFSAIIYCTLLGTAMRHVFRYVRQTSFTGMYAQTLFLSLVGVVPWFMVTHAAVSSPRAAMMFFMLLGFVHVLSSWGTRNTAEK